jgi:hypothetical protein
LPCEAFTDEQLIDLECMVEEIVRRGIKRAPDSD